MAMSVGTDIPLFQSAGTDGKFYPACIRRCFKNTLVNVDNECCTVKHFVFILDFTVSLPVANAVFNTTINNKDTLFTGQQHHTLGDTGF